MDRNAILEAASAVFRSPSATITLKEIPQTKGARKNERVYHRAIKKDIHDYRELFIKMYVSEGWSCKKEIEVAIWAGEMQFSPLTYQVTCDRILVSEYLKNSTLSSAQIEDPIIQQAFCGLMFKLHNYAENEYPIKKGEGEVVLDLDGWNKWKETSKDHMQMTHNFLDWEQLASLMERSISWLMKDLRDRQENEDLKLAFCHYDASMKNLIWCDNNLWLIDWELAQWSDPFRDIAKFFGYHIAKAEEMQNFLRCYLQRMPRPQELERFRQLTRVMAVDHYSYMMLSSRNRTIEASSLASKIERLFGLMAEK